jgi:hypothetical protein
VSEHGAKTCQFTIDRGRLDLVIRPLSLADRSDRRELPDACSLESLPLIRRHIRQRCIFKEARQSNTADTCDATVPDARSRTT